ncbi:hypothetical protein [Lysinibacillus xylanilyticus]|uniref:hypothetical protein n=1 Tax=Lysinibacillus xylanilyticus TaxID=582475 RepID=UPI003D079685
MTLINTELQKRLNELKHPNKEILEQLIKNIETIKQRDEVKNLLRTQIREHVAMEMEK